MSTPEQKRGNRKSASPTWKRKLSNRVFASTGISLARLGIFAFALVAVIGFVAFMVIQRQQTLKEEAARTTPQLADPPTSTVDSFMANMEPTKILNLAKTLPPAYKKLPFPLKAKELESRIEVIEKLRAEPLSDSELSEANQLLSRYFFLYDSLYLSKKLDRAVTKKRFEEFNELLLQSSNATEVSTGRYVATLASVNELLYDPTTANADAAIKTLQMYGEAGVTGASNAKALATVVMELYFQQPNNSDVMRVQNFYGETLASNPDPEISGAGESILENIAFKGADIVSLRDKIALGIKGAESKFNEALLNLEGFPNASPRTYQLLTRANESFLSQEKVEVCRQNAENMLEITLGISDPRFRAYIQETLKQQIERIDVLGTKLDVSGTAVDGSILPEVEQYTAIFFWSVQNPAVTESLNAFAKAHSKKSDHSFAILAVCIEQLPQLTKDEIASIQSNMVFTSDETAAKMLKQCPISNTPYIIVVDPGGQVVALNVPLSKLDHRMTQITKNARLR